MAATAGSTVCLSLSEEISFYLFLDSLSLIIFESGFAHPRPETMSSSMLTSINKNVNKYLFRS